MTIDLFDRARLTAAPWKNGGGTTREIVRRPAIATSEGYDWRVSIAELTRDGPFSIFSGYDRTIVLLEGDGVQLRSGDGKSDGDGDIDAEIDHQLNQPLTPFAFSGERDVYAALIGSVSSDFNVMARRAAVSARVKVCRASEVIDASPGGVLFAARGNWLVTAAHARSTDHGRDATVLRPNTGLWWDSEPLSWDVRPRVQGTADDQDDPDQPAILAVSIRER